MFPHVEGEKGPETVRNGVIGAGVLGDGQFTVGVCLEPYPAAAEEANAFGFEVGLEGFEASPLLDNLGKKGRFFAALRMTRSELREVQLVIQDLAGVVEHATRFRVKHGMTDYLLQALSLQFCPGNELIQVVHIGLKVLAVVEREGFITDHRRQGLVWKVN